MQAFVSLFGYIGLFLFQPEDFWKSPFPSHPILHAPCASEVVGFGKLIFPEVPWLSGVVSTP
jgi:hypothetical protein